MPDFAEKRKREKVESKTKRKERRRRRIQNAFDYSLKIVIEHVQTYMQMAPVCPECLRKLE